VTNDELIELKQLCETAKPYTDEDESLAGVPWEDVSTEDKERISSNNQFFEKVYEKLPEIIDELLMYRSVSAQPNKALLAD